MTIRPTNCWGTGDLPAPYAIGDVVVLYDYEHHDTIDPGTYVVVAVDSVDEGDAWRIYIASSPMGRRHKLYECWAKRSDWHEAHDLFPFVLHRTEDPEGLAKRNVMLAEGWTFEPTPTCPTCGHPLPKGDS